MEKYMGLVETVEQLNKLIEIPKCPEKELKTVKEFYEKLIEPFLLDKETVLAWHRILVRYLEDADAILILRKYSSSKINGEWATRRGMLTKYNNRFYVGVDNYFPQLLYGLVSIRYVPTYEEFSAAMKNYKMPVRFKRETAVEKTAAFPAVKFNNVGINNNNWKLSHILSANKGYGEDSNNELKNGFKNEPNGKWVLDDENSYSVRLIDRDMTEKELKALKAHFLRVCSPLNYFLTPKVSFHKYELEGKDIGEEELVLEYVKRLFKDYYGDEFSKFLEIAENKKLFTCTTSELGDTVINLRTREGINPKTNGNKIEYSDSGTKKQKKGKNASNSATKSKISGHKPIEIETSKLYEMIIHSIVKKQSLRTLEQKFLGIEVKNNHGGHDASKLLGKYGIQSKLKGTINTFDELRQLMNSSTGTTHETLFNIVKWIDRLDEAKRGILFDNENINLIQ